MSAAAPEIAPVVGKLLPPKRLPLCVDFYKGGHHAFLNPKLQHVYHYLESRGGEFDNVVCAGASFVAKVLSEYTLTREHIDEAEELFAHSHTNLDLQLDRQRWEALISKHEGKLPLKILALPDGTTVPIHTPMLVVHNTDPEFAWLPGYVESWLLSVVYLRFSE